MHGRIADFVVKKPMVSVTGLERMTVMSIVASRFSVMSLLVSSLRVSRKLRGEASKESCRKHQLAPESAICKWATVLLWNLVLLAVSFGARGI